MTNCKIFTQFRQTYISQPFESTQIKTFVCHDSATVATSDVATDNGTIYIVDNEDLHDFSFY
ncbi:fasciclin domain-containing protein [Symplocastrum sp. BBK-W-15]|uniref:Fasciclin domain-containing protein n=1 Tax=Limnofasciculus baicalensis BBK-W-15 TaxID=2699891 RepID=A0AAE3GP69_9CYAN|nr:fasciclin domain-containing protein [Limnofasciculus baicalensis BBK-W-15]